MKCTITSLDDSCHIHDFKPMRRIGIAKMINGLYYMKGSQLDSKDSNLSCFLNNVKYKTIPYFVLCHFFSFRTCSKQVYYNSYRKNCLILFVINKFVMFAIILNKGNNNIFIVIITLPTILIWFLVTYRTYFLFNLGNIIRISNWWLH